VTAQPAALLAAQLDQWIVVALSARLDGPTDPERGARGGVLPGCGDWGANIQNRL
jgi:hypothetical protein